MKRDVQGKFALKNEDYRLARSLRLTDETWKALGIAAEGLGVTKADYLEQIIRDQILPSNTRKEEETHPSITRIEVALQPSITQQEEEVERLKAEIQDLSQENVLRVGRATIALPQILDLEALREPYEASPKGASRFV